MPALTKYVSDQLRDEVSVMKEQRKAREEKESEKSADRPGGGKPGKKP